LVLVSTSEKPSNKEPIESSFVGIGLDASKYAQTQERSVQDDKPDQEIIAKGTVEQGDRVTWSGVRQQIKAFLQDIDDRQKGAEFEKLDPIINQATHDFMVLNIRGEVVPNKETFNILCARVQFEQARLPEIAKYLMRWDRKLRNNWMACHEKAQRLATIEGRMFAERLSESQELSRADYSRINNLAKRELRESMENVKHYTDLFMEKHNDTAEVAHNVAKQFCMFKERYGFEMESEKLKNLRKAVENCSHKELRDLDLKSLKMKELDSAHQHLKDQGIQQVFKHILSEGKMPVNQKLSSIQQNVMKEAIENAKDYKKQREEIEKIRMQSRGMER
jgi:hypothetical protein